jgi:hypothetical protein
MKPTVGRIVLVFCDPRYNNGAEEAPAVVTRVWSDTMINVHVLPDSGALYVKTSVTLHATRDEAMAAEREISRGPVDWRIPRRSRSVRPAAALTGWSGAV